MLVAPDARAHREPLRGCRADGCSCASSFARTALANVAREYPNKPDHVLGGSRRRARPARAASGVLRQLRLALVRAHALAARARAPAPSGACRSARRSTSCSTRISRAAQHRAECAYLARPESPSFERTYGWAWLLELARELARRTMPRASLGVALAPLADAFVARYLDYLPRQRYPLRHGVHPNSAFGLAVRARLRAMRAATRALARGVHRRARCAGSRDDRDAPAAWEPSGADFLSPALMEADLMRRVLAPDDFAAGSTRSCRARAREPARFRAGRRSTTAAIRYIVHLDGLNLSRAWCMRGIARALPAADPRGAALGAIAAQPISPPGCRASRAAITSASTGSRPSRRSR